MRLALTLPEMSLQHVSFVFDKEEEPLTISIMAAGIQLEDSYTFADYQIPEGSRFSVNYTLEVQRQLALEIP